MKLKDILILKIWNENEYPVKAKKNNKIIGKPFNKN
jgi:hypothetical protein